MQAIYGKTSEKRKLYEQSLRQVCCQRHFTGGLAAFVTSHPWRCLSLWLVAWHQLWLPVQLVGGVCGAEE